jgi:hypothetical protein
VAVREGAAMVAGKVGEGTEAAVMEVEMAVVVKVVAREEAAGVAVGEATYRQMTSSCGASATGQSRGRCSRRRPWCRGSPAPGRTCWLLARGGRVRARAWRRRAKRQGR